MEHLEVRESQLVPGQRGLFTNTAFASFALVFEEPAIFFAEVPNEVYFHGESNDQTRNSWLDSLTDGWRKVFSDIETSLGRKEHEHEHPANLLSWKAATLRFETVRPHLPFLADPGQSYPVRYVQIDEIVFNVLNQENKFVHLIPQIELAEWLEFQRKLDRNKRTIFVGPSTFTNCLFPYHSLLNHSCVPNCRIAFGGSTVGGIPMFRLYAEKDIQQGEELTFDYFGSEPKSFPCLCPACQQS
eukprot:TRINITY_DN31842_c0_g1_i1.p1 TRINITY_DN31842_c0_g1~~TRINITY_DN31842_c0_g1_i1.p1  ORF type:complete len:256 (-),score=0.63 TRINITY_DN31842_c0_g1_i1:37-765(-)